MFNSRPVRLLWRSLNWLTRLTLLTSAVAAALCAVIIVLLRYWLLPDIEQFHGRITSSLSEAMGNPVSIGKISGNWDGLHPHLKLTEVRILDGTGQPALTLPRVDASVSWLSLLAAELRLASLEIERPELLIRRDAQGKIHVGSVAVSSGDSNNDLSNWLLHQSRVVVRNAVIVWLDEQRNAPPLMLDQVNVRIENLFSHHRFALQAVPPVEVSAPLDVRGDFHGKRLDDLAKWNGQLYTRLDYTDLLAWRPWLTLPAQLNRGRGALRGWMSIKAGKLSQITVDLVLQDVATRLGDDVPEMDVHSLRGRASWQIAKDGWEISTRHMAMQLHNGLALQPTDFYFHSVASTPTQPSGGRLSANLLQLESLVSLANFLPLEAGLRSQLNAFAPRGRVANIDIGWQETPTGFTLHRIKGEFDDLAIQQSGKLPGFSGLSFNIDGSYAEGSLSLKAKNLSLNAPEMLREAIDLHTLTGQVKWQREQGEISVHAANISLANDDLAGNLYGSFQTKENTPGIADLTLKLTRANLKHAAKYIPLVALDKSDNDWLNDALLSGHSEDLHLRLKGNLGDFPLDGSKDALLEIGAQAKDVAMDYATGWPKIENLSGEFTIHNNRMEVRASSATMLGARISKLSIVQPDLSQADAQLHIKGEAEGGNNVFLQFIQQSPVRGYINGFTDGVSASGNGHLDLTTQIPLRMTRPATLSGLFRVQGSDIDLGPGVPWLRNTKGELTFTETGMKSNTVNADILGGPARLNVQTAEGGEVRASLQGRANIDVLRKSENSPLLGQLQGGAAWDANISVIKKIARVTLNSNLQGISSSLPAPLNKAANEIWPVHIEKKSITENQSTVTAQVGKLLSARLISSDGAYRKGVINFGGPVADNATNKDGIWLTGRLPSLSLQGWGALGAGSGQAIPVSGASVHIDKITGYGLSLKDIGVNAVKRGDGLSAQLSSIPLNGEITWLPHGYNGTAKLSARLRNLYWSGEEVPTQASAKEDDNHPQDLPAVDIAVEDLIYKGKNIGHFDLVGFPEGQNWRLARLHATNQDGSLSGDGLWQGAQTRLNLLLEISNAGKILTRSGYPGTVKNGSGKLNARLNWDGQPDDFNYATLNGTLKLDTGQGQFLKMEPGIGKLLGILSLQALPKRITLDFTDVFSAGFEFDNINGNATIKQGIIHTDDLHIDGSSAKVTMAGDINLNDETQNLHVAVLPTLGSSVSMLSAFAAGPVVGIGTLIVSKVLGNPLDKLISFEYNVSGTWSNPNVLKVGEKQIKVEAVKKTDKK